MTSGKITNGKVLATNVFIVSLYPVYNSAETWSELEGHHHEK
jgi:hypothetical protein